MKTPIKRFPFGKWNKAMLKAFGYSEEDVKNNGKESEINNNYQH